MYANLIFGFVCLIGLGIILFLIKKDKGA
jgi:hypothetical protein